MFDALDSLAAECASQGRPLLGINWADSTVFREAVLMNELAPFIVRHTIPKFQISDKGHILEAVLTSFLRKISEARATEERSHRAANTVPWWRNVHCTTMKEWIKPNAALHHRCEMGLGCCKNRNKGQYSAMGTEGSYDAFMKRKPSAV